MQASKKRVINKGFRKTRHNRSTYSRHLLIQDFGQCFEAAVIMPSKLPQD